MRRPLVTTGLKALVFAAALYVGGPACRAAGVVSCQGVVQGWNPFGNVVSIAVATGLFARTTVDVVVVPSSRITREGLPANFIHIRVGDTARCTLHYVNGRYEVLEIDVATTNGRRISTASLLAMDSAVPNEPSFLYFEMAKGSVSVRARAVYDSHTLFWKEGGPCEPQDIAPTDVLSLVVAPQGDGTLLATRVEASIPPQAKPYAISGVVVCAEDGLITVRAANGVEANVEVSQEAYIRKDGTRIYPADVEQTIQRGDWITASGDLSESYNLLAVSMSVASPEYSVRGVVLENRFIDSTLIVRTNEGSVAVLVTKGTTIQISGFPADLSDVRLGSIVEIRASSVPGGRWLLASLDVIQ